MSIIDLKLIDAYTVLVLAEQYIINEEDRKNSNQLLVPIKYKREVEIKVAEKTIEVLNNGL